jgi:hypothetical protein
VSSGSAILLLAANNPANVRTSVRKSRLLVVEQCISNLLQNNGFNKNLVGDVLIADSLQEGNQQPVLDAFHFLIRPATDQKPSHWGMNLRDI